jgi:hypothetical protein
MNVDVLVSKEGWWKGSFQVYIVQNKDAITTLMKALGKLFDDIVSIVYTNRQGYNMTYCSIILYN